MAAYLYDRLVTENEYRQRIQRHRPSSLLPLIAAAASLQHARAATALAGKPLSEVHALGSG